MIEHFPVQNAPDRGAERSRSASAEACLQSMTCDAQPGRYPTLGVALLCWRGAMFRQRLHRVSLPRARGLTRKRRHVLRATEKRAVKRAMMRDCCRRCVYCGDCLDLSLATIDHVYPLAHGGAHAPGNLVVACAPCNRLKGDMLPHEFFFSHPTAGLNFLSYARVVHRALKRSARRAVSLALAAAAAAQIAA